MRPRTSLKRLLALSGDLGHGRCLLLSDRGRECMVAASCTMFLATSWAVDNARLRDSDEGKRIVCAACCGGEASESQARVLSCPFLASLTPYPAFLLAVGTLATKRQCVLYLSHHSRSAQKASITGHSL